MNPQYFALHHYKRDFGQTVYRKISADGKWKGLVVFENYMLKKYGESGMGIGIGVDRFFFSKRLMVNLGADDLFGVDAEEMILKTFFPEDSGTESGDNYAP